jgi:ABC-type bacteriocin/lantibiotic exporter with double-glycine peptidase domain
MLRKRFPLTLQHDHMQCGAACLDMVCRHYGRQVVVMQRNLLGEIESPRITGTVLLIHSDEEYLVVTRKINIFALYNVNKHSMLRQKREKSGTGICHVMQGKE